MTDNGRKNFNSFIWHSVFLALTLNFVDINTVVPNLILQSGGGPIYLGLLTAIMVGGTGVMQIFFAGFLMDKPRKKKYLITAISFRISALLLLGFILYISGRENTGIVFGPLPILLIMAVFAFSGSFANISYTDILGKAFPADRRKKFFIIKQTISSFGVIISAVTVRLVLGNISYPLNYTLLFSAAGLLLLTASFGFWRIREPVSQVMPTPGAGQKLKLFKKALTEDINLKYYLLIINTSGIILGLIPFLIGLARQEFTIDGSNIGNFLIIQMVGSLGTNLLFNAFNKNQKYRSILYYFIILGAFVPLAALTLSLNRNLYPLIFLFSGSSITAYQIAIPGILLEISSEKNRPLYSGISGAGSIAVLIYPVISGLIISKWGYMPVFLISSVFILSGLYPATKIVCSRITGENKA